MSSFSRDYVGSKAPGALFAILLTLAVNVALFAVLAWVNKRDVPREPDSPTITARRAFVMPKREEAKKEPKKTVKKKEIKTNVHKNTPKAKPRAQRPPAPRPKPSMPTIRASLPTMALDLQGNLALPVGDGGLVADTGDTQPSGDDGIARPVKAAGRLPATPPHWPEITRYFPKSWPSSASLPTTASTSRPKPLSRPVQSIPSAPNGSVMKGAWASS